MKIVTAIAALLITGTSVAATHKVEVSVVTDWQTVQYYGGVDRTKAELTSRMSEAFTTYLPMGLQFEIKDLTVPASADADKIPGHTQPYILLDSMADYRSNNNEADLTILLTKRDLGQNKAGISNMNSACGNHGVAIAEVGGDVHADAMLAAHEMAHVIGAEHDGEAQCKDSPQTYIMTNLPFAITGSEFSQCSIDTVKENIKTFECFAPIVEKPVAVAAVATPAPTTAEPAKSGGGGSFDWLLLAVGGIALFLKRK